MSRKALLRLTTLMLLASSAAWAQGIITTVAGSTWIFPGGGGPAINAPLGEVQGVAVDPSGNVYVADIGNHLVVKVSPAGILTVVAGNGIRGFSGDGGPATSASLNLPRGVALDPAGNLYIADAGNNRVRKVSPAGIVTTVAGNGAAGYSGDGGPATAGSLNQPRAVAVEAAGNIYIADSFNNRIRKVTPSGTISTVAGNGSLTPVADGGPAINTAVRRPYGVALDAGGNLYIAERSGARIRKVNPSGIISTVAGSGIFGFSGDGGAGTNARLSFPSGVAVDAAGAIYIADTENYRIRKVSAQGTITSIAGNGVPGFSGDGGPATSGSLNQPTALAVDADGNLFIADWLNERARKVSAAGTLSTIAGNRMFKFSGDGGPATSATMRYPDGLALDPNGNLYISDALNHRIRKLSPDGTITTVAGNGTAGYSGDLGQALKASLRYPSGLALDSAGNLYICDANNNRVRKFAPNGTIATAAGNGTADFSGDSGFAAAAALFYPAAVAVDRADNLYIADTGNSRIRKVTPAGIITTVAGNGDYDTYGDGGPATSAALSGPYGVAVDAAGNLFIADYEANRVRKVSTTGTITTVAGNGTAGYSGDGGPATSASLKNPYYVIMDAAGNLYISDPGNHRIRKVSATGTITTVVGNGVQGFSGDGGPAAAASLNSPSGLALDAAGNLYLGDSNNDRIRKVLVTPPSFSVAPTSLSFSATAGSATAATQQLKLNSNVAGLGWQSTVRTASGGSWLTVAPASGQMPAAITVSVDATSLAAGEYKGSIDISVPAATPSLQTVAVTLTVFTPQAAKLSVEPLSLSFQGVLGQPAPPAQALRIENAGGGALNWTLQAAMAGGNWLSVSAASGAAPARVEVRVNPTGLAAGSYSGSLTVRGVETNQSINIPVSLLVSSPAGVLLLSQSNLLFRGVEAGGVEPPQTFGVLNIGSGSLDWTAESTALWLRVSPTSGRSEAGSARIPLVSVSVDVSRLVAGLYVGLVRVTSATANNSPQVLRVDLQVLPRDTKLGAVVRPTGLIFVAAAGGSSPGSQEVGVATTETAPIEFISQPIDGPWVFRAPDLGIAGRDTPGRIVVQPDLGTLAAGVYRAGLTVFTRNDGEQHPVRLLFLVLPAGALPATASGALDADDAMAFLTERQNATNCAATQLFLQFASLFANFNATVGWPTTVLVNARDNCGNPAAGGTVILSFSSGEPAAALIDMKNGQYQGVWRPNAATSPLVTVTARGLWQGLQGLATATAQVGLNPNPQGAILSQGGVVLGAGFERGQLAPGSIVSLFGRNLAAGDNFASSLPLPKTLGGVRVLIGGKEAPLFYVGPGQVNAQVPAELEADRQLQVLLETNGLPSAPEPLQTAGNRPGIFTLGGTFGNQGAILIANTNRLAMPVTANVPSEPVQVGGVVSIYCTGLGATEPAVASGNPGPSDPLAVVKTPVTVTIGGQAAKVTFAGMAPGFVGVYQVNAEVPSGITPGDAVPVVITQGNARSNTATIAVQ